MRDITIFLRLHDHIEKNAGYSLILHECCRVVNRGGRAKLKRKRENKIKG